MAKKKDEFTFKTAKSITVQIEDTLEEAFEEAEKFDAGTMKYAASLRKSLQTIKKLAAEGRKAVMDMKKAKKAEKGKAKKKSGKGKGKKKTTVKIPSKRDLEKTKKADLKKLAKKAGVKFKDDDTKAVIIKALLKKKK